MKEYRDETVGNAIRALSTPTASDEFHAWLDNTFASEGRHQSFRPRGLRGKRRRVVLALAACVAVASAAALFVAGAFNAPKHHLSSGPAGNVGDAYYTWTSFGDDPFGSAAQQITYQALAAEAPDIPLPNTSLAGPDNAGSVWTISEPTLKSQGLPEATGKGVAAAVYYPSSGIELMWFPGPVYYAGSTRDENQTIDGVHALVQTFVGQTFVAPVGPTGGTGCSCAKVHLARVSLPVGYHRLTLEGLVPGVTVSDLIKVAETLTPSPSSTP